MARGGFPNMGGANMQQLMRQAQKMQQDMQRKQAELQAQEFTATAGGGMVTAVVIAVVCLVYFTVICHQRNDFSMYFLCLLYLIVITVNCATVFSYAWSAVKKKPYLIFCAVGALSFFISDMLLGLEVLAGIYDYSFLVWWFYPIGQIIIIICG